MAVVRHVLRHPKTGVLLADRAVLFALTPDITVPAEHAQIVGGSYAVTDANGLMSIDLTPNSQLIPDGTSYVVKLPGVTWLIVVPDSEPPNVDGEIRYWWLDDIRVGSAPDVGPVFHQIPAGGTDGQVLTKASDTNFDADWEDPAGGGGTDVAISDATGYRLDTETYLNPQTGDPMPVMVFPASPPEGAQVLYATALEGDAFPRQYVFVNPGNGGGIDYGDGTQDPWNGRSGGVFVQANGDGSYAYCITAFSGLKIGLVDVNVGRIAQFTGTVQLSPASENSGGGPGNIQVGHGAPVCGGSLGDPYFDLDGDDGAWLYRCTTEGAAGDAVWEAKL